LPAGEVSARFADTYLTWGETPQAVAEKITWIVSLAAQHQRSITHGIRFHVIARVTSAVAWSVAANLLSGITPDKVAAAQAGLAPGIWRSIPMSGPGSACSVVGPVPPWWVPTPR